MKTLEEFLNVYSPFLAANWNYITLGTISILFAALIWQMYLNPARNKVIYKKPKMVDKSEHPLSEFKEEMADPDQPTSLHSPDLPHVKYSFVELDQNEMIEASQSFYIKMNQRRSVRHFSSKPVPIDVIRNIIKTAGTSPSGAHCEPWTFVVVKDQKVKAEIRNIIEQEEYLNYDHRMGKKWVQDLQFVRTNHEKPYLETAPYLIIVFKQQYHIDDNGSKHNHYYYEISTAIACGILITAIHNAGLVTVTTTPLNAGVQLRELLGRPSSEKVMVLLPVGYPANDATVPDITRKQIDDIMVLI